MPTPHIRSGTCSRAWWARRTISNPSRVKRTLKRGDRFLLCTDGIHGKLDSAALTSLLKDASSAADGATRLVDEAITRGTTDNATALVFTVS